MFRSQIPGVEKSEFLVAFEQLGDDDSPVVITQNEYMRRMKEMAALQPGMELLRRTSRQLYHGCEHEQSRDREAAVGCR